MKFIKFFFLLAAVSGALPAHASPRVVSSINPIAQIVLAITQDKNNSILIINPNISEHDYQLKKSDAAALDKADLIFYVDENLERNFAKIAKRKNSYQLSQVPGIKLLGKRGDEKKPDLHVWLDPENGIKIAEFITKKICEIDVGNCQNYQENLQKFKKEIYLTIKSITSQLSEIKLQNYVLYYDAYQYFENYFGLNPKKIITQDHGHELSVKAVREFDALTKTTKIQCLFGDKYDEKNSAQKLAMNYKINFATLDLIGGEGGYAKLLVDISKVISGCLKHGN